MADDDFETPEIWDEYQWERFLQQQDRNTEKYFGLLERYLDHPDRDNIIAKEMDGSLSTRIGMLNGTKLPRTFAKRR